MWVPPGQDIELAGTLIKGGGIYVGLELTAAGSASTREPALIDPTLPANFAKPDWTENTLQYWPSYHLLTPEVRAGFLSWLGWGRDSATAPIGFVFLYFYGLERRSLIDADQSPVAHAELLWILGEVERLLAIYGPGNQSFASYGSRLAALVRLLVYGAPSEPPHESSQGWELPFDVNAGLGQLMLTGQPISADWAIAWVSAHPQYYLRTPAHRCPDEFAELFRRLYADKYGDGMVVPPPKRTLTISYRPASAGIYTIDVDFPHLCDVGGLTAPVKKLASLAAVCTDALDSYSRWLGRHPEGRGSLAALALLPPALIEDRLASSELLSLIEWCEGVLGRNSEGVADATGLIACWSSNATKLTKLDSGEFARLLEVKGYGIEPDVRYGGPPLQSGTVALFRLAEGRAEQPVSAWDATRVLLQLAGSVVASWRPDPPTVELMAVDLCRDVGLAASAQPRVRAHLLWALSTSKVPKPTKRALDGLAQPSRESFGRLLIGLATRYSPLGPAQVTALSNAYTTLGLAPSSVYSLIHERSTAHPAPDLVMVRKPRPALPGEAIPSPLPETFAVGPAAATHVVLDSDVIARRLADSAQAAALLGAVFADDDTLPIPAPEPTKSDSNAELLRHLATRPTWTRAEFDSLANSLGMLPNGALESLNDAAFETCGESLIEGDDVLEINPAVLEELL